MRFFGKNFVFKLSVGLGAAAFSSCISGAIDGGPSGPDDHPDSEWYGVARVECVDRSYKWTFRFGGDSTALPDSATYIVRSVYDAVIPWQILARDSVLATGAVAIELDTVISDTVIVTARMQAQIGDSMVSRTVRLHRNQSLPPCPQPAAHLNGAWISRASLTSEHFTGILWNASRLVAVGTGGRIQTSHDGVAWTSQSSGTTHDLASMLWTGDLWSGDAGRFVVVGEGGVILTSSDGLVWTPQISGTAQRLRKVIWTGPTSGRFVAVGDSGIIVTSSDGFTWTPRASGTARRLYDVAANDTQMVAVGDYGVIISSTDGIIWNVRRPEGSAAEQFSNVEWTGLVFKAYNSGSPPNTGPYAISSVDGVVWEVVQEGGSYSHVYRFGAQFAVVHQPASDVSAEAVVYLSPVVPGSPGSSNLGTTTIMTGLAWTGERLVAVGHGGKIMTLP